MFFAKKRVLDGEALAATARALGVRILEHEARGEINLDPVHRAADQVEHARAVASTRTWTLIGREHCGQDRMDK